MIYGAVRVVRSLKFKSDYDLIFKRKENNVEVFVYIFYYYYLFCYYYHHCNLKLIILRRISNATLDGQNVLVEVLLIDIFFG